MLTYVQGKVIDYMKFFSCFEYYDCIKRALLITIFSVILYSECLWKTCKQNTGDR